ncbi:hypothetical protein [Synechococcus sp. ROS8604]|uniref:hypothetical protein n=1 Tax=Synechococcus sp. ROS8604 TaxID=1442557 RepID=UPI001647DE2A|nr:hypothetical protein [Synechococcus sp. ROS8604]QNI87617.1 hypothetical protein SynROS8604_00974 [Synechococcus sp. ROS8604]
MIVLKIANSSEVVASKVGKFIEFLTPDSVDQSTVEDQVIKKLVENLAAEGIKGEIAAVQGIDLNGNDLNLRDGMKVRKHTSF